MASSEDYFSKCKTTLEVHNELRTLLVCDFLRPEDASLRFRMNCWSDIPDADRETATVDRILNHLTKTGKFSEGYYDFIKRKIDGIHVAVTDLIVRAEAKIQEIRENSLKVETSVTSIEPISLEEDTRSRVNAILLAVSEFLICKSNEPNTNIDSLWERYLDLQTWSFDFLSLWHTEYCKCQKQFGQQMLLQFIDYGATQLKHGQFEYDHFRYQIFPSLWHTLRESVKCTCDLMKSYGASPVSVARSSVLSFWTFNSIANLDKLWRKYEEESLHVHLQDCLNSQETLELLKVDRIAIRMIIKESDYIKYRTMLENRVHGTDVLTTLETLEIDPVKTTMETTQENPRKSSFKILKRKPTVIDPLSDTLIAHKKVETPLSYSFTDKRLYGPGTDVLASSEKTFEIDLVKTFKETTEENPMKSSVGLLKRKPTVKDPLSDPPIALVKGKDSIFFSMKKRLYEINKRLSETPTVLWSMLHSADEPLYVSVPVIQYDDPFDRLIYYNLNHTKRIEILPDEIFCTSDEYHWKRKRSKNTYLSDKSSYKHPYIDTCSTCVFLIGEPECGKTAYCLNLLQKWCQREALGKFDFVFYVDLSVLQTSMESVAYLISTRIYGDIFDLNQIDKILRTEKCLVIMDGEDNFNEKAHSRYKAYTEISEQLRMYCNCVFVFTMRILNLLHEDSFHGLEYLSRRVPCRLIELLRLDERGMTSLYSKICDINRSSGSKHKTEEGDYQFRIKKATLEKETKQSEAELHKDVEVSVDVQKKMAGSDTAKSDSEQQLKEMKDYDMKHFNFNKIKEMLKEDLCESYDSIMKIPMLGSVCVRSLVEGKDVPKNRTSLYLCLVDKLIERKDASKETLQRIKEDKRLEFHALFQPYVNIHRHVDTLCKLGKLAYDNAYSPAAIELLNYKKLDGYLDKSEIEFSLESRLIVPVQTLSDETCVRFVHKSIQDSLVAMYIVTEKDDVFESLRQRLTSVDVIINISHVIMIICGLNHHLGSRITYAIKDTVDKDRSIERHRCMLSENIFIYEYYKVQLSWYTAYKTLISTMREETMNTFYVSDIYIDRNTDTDTMSKTITLMFDKNVVVQSLYVDDVPTERGLSDTVLNGFLLMNTSLESIFIWGKRTIEPLSIPYLRRLEVHDVHIQYTRSDDETAKSLLSHLPMLQSLELCDMDLNNIFLGLTSSEGVMPMLKKMYFLRLDIGQQSIELSPDMKYIEDIRLSSVKMSPQSLKLFVKSFIDIQHSFEVEFYKLDIDDELKEMIRTNNNFEVTYDDRFSFYFKRVYPLQ